MTLHHEPLFSSKTFAILFALATSVVAFSDSSVLEGTKCMASYRKSISDFEVCKDHPCLIFKEAVSYISVRPTNFTRHPFKCKEALTKYKKDLIGPYFHFIQTIPALADAFCIFAGEECSFDNQIEFLRDAYKTNQRHQFMVTGLMFIMSYRINNYSIPSTPFTHGPILVVGPRESSELSFVKTLDVVSGPFETTAWVFIIIVLFSFVFVRICISFSFTFPINLKSFWWNVWGEYTTAKKYQNDNPDILNMENMEQGEESNSDNPNYFSQSTYVNKVKVAEIERNREALEFYNKYWTVSAKLFLFLTVLFYELALFTHVFEILTRSPRKNIRNITKSEMEDFVLVKDSGYESYFRVAADPGGAYDHASDSKIPWKRVDSVADAFKSVMTNRTFSICYERSLIREMKNNDACENLTFYETDAQRSYNGGWYYSKAVPEETRIAIDRELSQQFQDGSVDEILHTENGLEYMKCRGSEPRISFMLLFLPLLPMSLFLLLGIFLRILCDQILKLYCRGRSLIWVLN